MHETVIALLILYIACQVCWDYYTHDDRQRKWEREHPGDIYIPGYRRYQKKQAKIKRMNGEV